MIRFNGVTMCGTGPKAAEVACSVCSTPMASRLCYYPVGPHRTCNAPLCTGCTFDGGAGLDFCPRHTERLDYLGQRNEAQGAA